jgi:hypothetical protein
MRTLATIQKISALSPIAGADAIETAQVLGWQVVVKKGEFQVGSLVIYCEIDSIMPEREEFEFLRPRKFKIKTLKLRGQISQGICFPLSILPEGFAGEIKEGTDCTDALGVTKYEPPTPQFLQNKQATRLIFPKWMPSFMIHFLRQYFPGFCERFRKEIGAKTWPQFLTKTDETRVQILQPLLDKYAGTECFIAEKLDGSSVTYFVKDGKFGVCSRNLELPFDENNGFWKGAIMYGIEEKLLSFGKDIAIQGELIGEGIQGNKYELKGLDVYFYQAFNIKSQNYYGYQTFTALLKLLGLKQVPVLNISYVLADKIEDLVSLSVGKSVLNQKAQREGIVIRPLQEIYDYDFKSLVSGRLSFKVINPEFLLKYGE